MERKKVLVSRTAPPKIRRDREPPTSSLYLPRQIMSSSHVVLIVHCPSAHISSERSFSTSQTLSEFKARVEQLTGVPPSDQILSIHSSRTDDADQVPPSRLLLQLPKDDSSRDAVTLSELGINTDGLGIKVVDDRPDDVARMFVDESQLKERFELTEEEYKNRSGEWHGAM